MEQPLPHNMALLALAGVDADFGVEGEKAACYTWDWAEVDNSADAGLAVLDFGCGQGRRVQLGEAWVLKARLPQASANRTRCRSFFGCL